MQKRGREWADALHVHTGRTARWAYMHKAKHHLKRGVVDNGCPANGDDMVFETKHRKNKLYNKMVYQGGQAEGVQSGMTQHRPTQIVAPPVGRGERKRRTETYDSRAVKRAHNEAPATQVGHLLKIAEHYESLEPPRKKTKRVVSKDGIKVEEARESRCKTLEALEAELERLSGIGEN